MKQQKLVTKQSLQQLIDEADPVKLQRIVGRALVVLFQRQTDAEKRSNTVNNHNNIGFRACDARRGSLGAKSFLKNGSLQDWQVEQWVEKQNNGYSRICVYHRQLNEAAMERQR